MTEEEIKAMIADQLEASKPKPATTALDGELGKLSKSLQKKLEIEQAKADNATVTLSANLLKKQTESRKSAVDQYLKANPDVEKQIPEAFQDPKELEDFAKRLQDNQVTVHELKLLARMSEPQKAEKVEDKTVQEPGKIPGSDVKSTTQANALLELDAIVKDASHPIYHSNHPQHHKELARVRELDRVAFGQKEKVQKPLDVSKLFIS